MIRSSETPAARLRASLVRLPLVAALVAAMGASIAPSARAAAGPDDLAVAEITAPVEVDGSVLFRVRGVSALPAAERASHIRERIVEIAGDPTVRTDDLRVVESGEYLTIAADDRAMLTLIGADAELERVSLRALADVYRHRIVRAIEAYRSDRTPESLLQSGLRALAATVALALSVGFVWWLARRIDALVERRFRRRIKTLGIQSFELVRAERIWGGFRALLHGFRTLAILALGFFWLSHALALFPWTRAYANQLLRLVLGPLRTIGGAVGTNVPNLLFLAILFVIVRFALRMTRLFFEAVERGRVTLSGFDPEWAGPTYKIARLAIVAFGLIVAYPYVPGSQSAAFKGVSLFLGVVFSLGSSSAISNIVAGYTMTYRRAFRVGDRVKIGETIGDVIEMRLQVTHLRSLKNEEVIVPNSQILNSEIVNFSSLAKQQGLILHTTVGIGYEVPWRQVEALLLLAARRTEGLLEEPAPFVLHRKLGDFAVDYEINAYCRDAHDMMPLYTALHRNILDLFNEYGVQIMTPSYEKDPEQPKLVAREQWYAAPASPERIGREDPGEERGRK